MSFQLITRFDNSIVVQDEATVSGDTERYRGCLLLTDARASSYPGDFPDYGK